MLLFGAVPTRVSLSSLSRCLYPAGQLTSTEARRLADDGQWQSSRFGQLESFIFDFLCGGRDSGEAVRLKLQTPLFMADALLEAAGQQLAAELQTAEEVRQSSLITSRKDNRWVSFAFRHSQMRVGRRCA